MLITRQKLLLGVGAVGMLAIVSAHAEGRVLTAEGLYKESWFLQNGLVLADALESTTAQGKRFAIMWEVKGCTYCRETHLVNFAQPRIVDYINANFKILQLNTVGSRMVTDFDGVRLSEKQLAAKYRVRFTPSFLFFPERVAPLKKLPVAKREVARAPGYLRPDDFLAFLHFVREKAYKTKSFREFFKSGVAEPASPTCEGKPLQKLPLLKDDSGAQDGPCIVR